MEGNMSFKELHVPKNPKNEITQDKMEIMRSRVEKLGTTDNPYEDSIKNLATEEDVERQELLADGISGVLADRIANRNSTKSLEKMEAEKEKWIDDLTQLPNKNAFLAEAKKYLALEKRMGNSSSFLMIDYDHFKNVNDMYGHSAGDDALKKISQIMKVTVRDSDIVYRFGGEEFVIFMPNTDSRSALILAERIRSAVESAVIDVMDEEGNNIGLKKTVSIGCIGTDQISREESEDSDVYLNDIVEYADRAMYASKKNGRNRTTLFDESLEESIKKATEKKL